MTVQLTITGDKVSFEREISGSTAPEIMDIAMSVDPDEATEQVVLSMEGEGMSFEREIPIRTGIHIMDVAIQNGQRDVAEGEGGEPNLQQPDTLPDGFFNNLSEKQEALLEILAESDDYVLNSEIRRQMRDEHGLKVSEQGRALAGVIAGFTRKYDRAFTKDLLNSKYTGNEYKFRLGEKYGKEVREGIGH